MFFAPIPLSLGSTRCHHVTYREMSKPLPYTHTYSLESLRERPLGASMCYVCAECWGDRNRKDSPWLNPGTGSHSVAQHSHWY